MSSPNSSNFRSIFESTKKGSRNNLILQIETDTAPDALQKNSRSASADLKENNKPRPPAEITDDDDDDAGYAVSPPAKRLKFHDNNAITVLVGDTKAAFTIHRGPICDVSAFFKGLFDNNFKETSEKVVTLEYHLPETFDQFLGFAYSRILDYAPFLALDDEEKWMAYGRLYVLADFLQVSTLQATIVSILFTQIGTTRSKKRSARITTQVIDYIYSNTARHCGIRKLIVAQHMWGSAHEPYRDADASDNLDIFLAGLHEDFVAELATEAMRRVWDKKTRDPFKGSSAQFHEANKLTRR